jgi:aspartate/methionine/tyrosine aminotransferase
MLLSHLPDFALERWFARWEFAAPYTLCSSDVEGWPMRELLDLADDQTRALWDNLGLGYTESAGHPLLREAIARQYESIAPEQTLVFSGAEEAILVALSVLLSAGDRAIVTWPGYQSLYDVARGAGADVDPWELHESDGWEPDLDALRRLVRPTTRVIVVNFPHNPTGALPDRATFEAIVEIARDAGAWLFSDEVYRGLEYDRADRLPAAADRYERALSLGVMSKAFALAGLRIGWIACQDTGLLARLASRKDYTTICSSAPSEILSLIALRSAGRVLARSRAIVDANLPLLDRFFAEHTARVRWVRPRAGAIAFPRLTGLGDRWRVDAASARLVDEEGVLILPGTLFGHGGNNFRLGFGRRNMPEALARFESFLSRG